MSSIYLYRAVITATWRARHGYSMERFVFLPYGRRVQKYGAEENGRIVWLGDPSDAALQREQKVTSHARKNSSVQFSNWIHYNSSSVLAWNFHLFFLRMNAWFYYLNVFSNAFWGRQYFLFQLFLANTPPLCHCSNLKPLLDTLGLYFQIRDDYANLSSKEVTPLYTP